MGRGAHAVICSAGTVQTEATAPKAANLLAVAVLL
jgi:hypothetical protein